MYMTVTGDIYGLSSTLVDTTMRFIFQTISHKKSNLYCCLLSPLHLLNFSLNPQHDTSIGNRLP